MRTNNKVLPWWGWIAAAGFIGSLVATGLLLLTDSSKTIWVVGASTLGLALLVGQDGKRLIQVGCTNRFTFFIGNVAALILGLVLYLAAVSYATTILFTSTRLDYLIDIWKEIYPLIIFLYLYYLLRSMLGIGTGEDRNLVREATNYSLYYIIGVALYAAFNYHPGYINKNIFFLVCVVIFLAGNSLARAANQEPPNDSATDQ